MEKLPTMVLKKAPAQFQNYPDWETIEDVGPVIGEPILELNEFLKKGEDPIDGKELIKRGKKLGRMAGQSCAEKLLTCQGDIPVEWRKFSLVFLGTIRRLPDRSDLCVAYLYWDDDTQKWYLGFLWLGDLFGVHYRLVRLGK